MAKPTYRHRRLPGGILFTYRRDGVGGVVPNHAPHIRKLIIAKRDGWHLHFKLSTLRTWNGHTSVEFRYAFNKAKKPKEAAHAQE